MVLFEGGNQWGTLPKGLVNFPSSASRSNVYLEDASGTHESWQPRLEC